MRGFQLGDAALRVQRSTSITFRCGLRSLRITNSQPIEMLQVSAPLNGYDDNYSAIDSIAVGTALRQGLGPPPAQIRACAANALGSCLGFDPRSGPTGMGEGCGQTGSSGSRGAA